MYMIANARWMTEGIETAAPKAKKANKYNAAPANYEQEINEKSRMNQRGSWMRYFDVY
jgi:hypothetical protein